MLRTYSELIALPTYEQRFNYLKLDGKVGKETFAKDRWANQNFYHSAEWRSLRDQIIVRDFGRDMAMEGYEIHEHALIHHMNPIELDDILEHSDILVNPEYLITVAYMTHQAIHYGNSDLLMLDPVVRLPGDTKLW